MGEWGYLGKFVEEVTKHPTVIGKVWVTALFIFRILIVVVAGESIWGDEQSDFVCNTMQPGCDNVCYDKAFPISHIRYWVLQLIFVSTPTLIYRCYKTYLSKEKERKQEEKNPKQEENKLCLKNGNVPEIEQDPAAVEKKIQEPTMSMYIVCVFCSSISEAGFLVGQWYLYGFFMVPRYVCKRDPCPHQVDCFISRPTEKSVFIIFMLVMGLISLVLNLLELFDFCYNNRFSNDKKVSKSDNPQNEENLLLSTPYPFSAGDAPTPEEKLCSQLENSSSTKQYV